MLFTLNIIKNNKFKYLNGYNKLNSSIVFLFYLINIKLTKGATLHSIQRPYKCMTDKQTSLQTYRIMTHK